MAFLDAGDQFIALSAPRRQGSDDSRHLGLVVDDPEAVREALESEGVEILPGRGLDFLDPWRQPDPGRPVRRDPVHQDRGGARSLGLDGLGKTQKAEAELRENGLID
jgi:lactoylglutathione lyase